MSCYKQSVINIRTNKTHDRMDRWWMKKWLVYALMKYFSKSFLLYLNIVIVVIAVSQLVHVPIFAVYLRDGSAGVSDAMQYWRIIIICVCKSKLPRCPSWGWSPETGSLLALLAPFLWRHATSRILARYGRKRPFPFFSASHQRLHKIRSMQR